MTEHEAQPTQRQIIQLLRTHGSMNANDLAKTLAISAVGVRRHLATLERDGFARATLVRQKMGRPTYTYALTDLAQDLFPKNYHTLANQLLTNAAMMPHQPGVPGRPMQPVMKIRLLINLMEGA